MASKLNSKRFFSVAQPFGVLEVVETVRQWFTAPENTNSLLIFDNLDDLESFDMMTISPHAAMDLLS